MAAVVSCTPHSVNYVVGNGSFWETEKKRIRINTLGGSGWIGGCGFRGNSQGHQMTAVKYLFGEANIA